MENSRFYFDHNATTAPSEVVKAGIFDSLQAWGNPSSIHWGGRGAKLLVRVARQNIAQSLGISPLEIVFTSGGSESNNAVIKGVYFKNLELNSNRDIYITSQIEHPSVMKSFLFLQRLGATVHFLKVDQLGQVDLGTYQRILAEQGSRVALVSMMMANNETGVLLPIQEMAGMAHAHGALFHTDAVQALGKIPVNLNALGVDFASFSAHKFYALKGTGFLFAKRGVDWTPGLDGGSQERSRRGGTENVMGIHALGLMLKHLNEYLVQAQRTCDLRNHLESRVLNEISACHISHQVADRLPNTSSFVISNVDGETLLMSLDLKGFAVSTGAACSSGNPEPSPVLMAIGLSREQAQSSLRISLGAENTIQEVDLFVDSLRVIVERLRKLHVEEASRKARAEEEWDLENTTDLEFGANSDVL